MQTDRLNEQTSLLLVHGCLLLALEQAQRAAARCLTALLALQRLKGDAHTGGHGRFLDSSAYQLEVHVHLHFLGLGDVTRTSQRKCISGALVSQCQECQCIYFLIFT